jgi:tetratricopeptide (TPR) repeat protein
MTPDKKPRTESVPTEGSVLQYHLTKLKTDGVIMGGAILSVVAILTTALVLHENANGVWLVPMTVGALTAVLIPMTVGVRELFRRRRAKLPNQSAPASPSRPLALFAFSLVFGLLLTAGLSRGTLESGVYYQIGQRQLANQDYLDAAETFSRFISVEPKKSIGYYKRGFAMYKAGQLDQAYADLKVAIERKPRDWNSRVLFLGTLTRLGRNDELKTELEYAEQLNPNAIDAVNQLLESIEG